MDTLPPYFFLTCNDDNTLQLWKYTDETAESPKSSPPVAPLCVYELKSRPTTMICSNDQRAMVALGDEHGVIRLFKVFCTNNGGYRFSLVHRVKLHQNSV